MEKIELQVKSDDNNGTAVERYAPPLANIWLIKSLVIYILKNSLDNVKMLNTYLNL